MPGSAFAESVEMALTYCLDVNSHAIAADLEAEAGPDAWRGGSLAPGQFAPVVVRAGRTGQRVIRPMHWGYPAPGQSSEMPGIGPPRWVPTVRNLESPYWIGNLRHSELRCLVPMTAFLLVSGKKGQRIQCTIAGARSFAVAGIWRDLTDMPVFAILTTEPSSALLPVEGGPGPSAMPAVLSTADCQRWLSADWNDAKTIIGGRGRSDLLVSG